MAKKPKRPSGGPAAVRQSISAARSRARSEGGFTTDAFTMKDEARNTGQHASLWSRDTRLRAKPIGFVSAGLIEPLKDELPDEQDERSSKEANATLTVMEDTKQQSSNIMPTDNEDVTLNKLEQSLAPTESPTSPGPATTADTTSASVADVPHSGGFSFMIDVTGDKTLAANLSRSPPSVPYRQSSAEESDSSSEVILFKGRANLAVGKRPVEQERTERTLTLDPIHYEVKAVGADMASRPKPTPDFTIPPRGRPPRHVKPNKFREAEEEEDAIIADYIANMAENSEEGDEGPSQQPFMSRDIGADEVDFGHDNLVLSELPEDSATSNDDQEDEIAIDGDVMDEEGSEDEGNDAIDDEELARLLAKQEELGMGSDELLLESGAVYGRRSAVYGNSSQNSRRGNALNRERPFPSASAVADAFDDLDLLDWARPSLQNQRRRGHRGQPPAFGLSDSETEQKLQTAWKKDRESKRSRKIRREELRAQGLLGKYANPDDPRLRYPTGMTVEDIKTEMRSFLVGSEPRLELPPMDKSVRKIVHELANKFKVKSQSTGSGDQRRPTLIRTKYTAAYTEENLEIAISRLGRRHFPRLDLKDKSKATLKKPRAGAGKSAVTYAEGEIVGASAPELGQENKGRAMLEKMGWSSGMGLGSLDNKGILQPVAHVVKRTKAGLG